MWNISQLFGKSVRDGCWTDWKSGSGVVLHMAGDGEEEEKRLRRREKRGD